MAGVLASFDGMVNALTESETIGQIMRMAAFMVIVPHVQQRFLGVRVEPGVPSPLNWTESRYKEDPVGPREDIASQVFSESGREEALAQALRSNQWVGHPRKTPYSVMLGVGDIDLMNKAAEIQQGKKGGKHHYLWMILEAGTGTKATDFSFGDTFSASNKNSIIRYGTQVFFDREGANPQEWEHVIVQKTESPGQVGRHFLFNLEGTFYDSDMDVMRLLKEYMRQQIQRFSYKGK